MNYEPTVSIMIPTYNQAHLLPRAIESALAQDYGRLEVVVSDDASTDATPEVVAHYRTDPRLRYLRQGANIGRVANYRWLLYEGARGDLAINLDGDDWFTDSGFIRSAVALFGSDPEIVLVFANAWSYRDRDQTLSFMPGRNRGLARINDGNAIFLGYAWGKVSMPHLTSVYRRRAAMEAGFFQRDIIGADTDSLLRLILGRKVGFIEDKVAVWHQHGANASWDPKVRSHLENLASIEGPWAEARNRGLFEARTLDRWRLAMSADLCLSHALSGIRSGNAGAVIQFLGALTLIRPRIAGRVAGGLIVRMAEHLTGSGAARWTTVPFVPPVVEAAPGALPATRGRKPGGRAEGMRDR